MATSGSLSTSKYDGRYYKLEWTATQNVSTNKSTISWTLSAVGGDVNWYAERTVKVVMAGKTRYSKTSRVERYKGQVASGEFTLTHDTSGNKSFSASVEAAVYYSTVNCTGSKNFTLTQIPRQATLTSAPNFNDEDNPAIKYSNPAGSSVTTLQACIASTDGKTIYVPYRDITKTGSSYTFSLTDSERTTLQNACTTAKSMKVKFYVKTVIGDNTYYSSIEKTLSIVNANPTISASAVDAGTASTKLTGDTSKIIKAHNYVSVSMTATGVKGATIKSYKITNGSKVINAASGSFSNTENNKFVFTATDSRGNSFSKTITLTMINYVKLTCNVDGKITLNDTDTTKADLTFTISGNYFNGSFGAVANALTIAYEKEDSSGGWSSETLDVANATIDGNTYSITYTIPNVEYQNSYIITGRVSDKIYNISSESKTLKTIPVFDWGENDFSINVPVSLLILQSPDGTNFKITVNDSGGLVSTKIS